MQEYLLTQHIIGAAMNVHSQLGPGLLESAYQECLAYELNKCGYSVQKEKSLPLVYEEITLECGYRVDLLVEDQIIIEVKAVDTLNDVHLAQVLTYLKLANLRLGLLMNFNVLRLKDGLQRVINNHYVE
ncbi:MAG: GxxExxY protein [Bacteroidota bacterium]